MNQYETQSIRERFLSRQFVLCGPTVPADVVLVNTCTVTQSADRKSRYAIRLARKNNPKALIIVTGCMVDKGGISGLEGADVIISKHFFIDGINDFCGRTRAFLKIQDGCGNKCSYCKVRLARGLSRSRAKEMVIKEARALVDLGFKEIVLTGICLGAYGRDTGLRDGLVELITEMESVNGLLRVRLSSIEANDVSGKLIDKLRNSSLLCPHLHIPFQSADNDVLRRMNRRYIVDDYREIVGKLMKKVPNFAISTDIMLGFPGEGESNFQNTVKFIEDIKPLKVHVFPYSPRPGTAAYNLKDHIPGHVVKKRIDYFTSLCDKVSFDFRKGFVGKELNVLIESKATGDNNGACFQGYSENYLKVRGSLQNPVMNKIVVFSIKKVYTCYSRGEERKSGKI